MMQPLYFVKWMTNGAPRVLNGADGALQRRPGYAASRARRFSYAFRWQ
jgi:hypothetical protein